MLSIIVETSRQFKEYQLMDVYQRLSDEQRHGIISLWEDNHILPPNESPEKRVNQVAVAISNASGEVVGVSSVYPEFRPGIGENAFMFRMFIREQDRIPSMMIWVVNYTFELLKNREIEEKPRCMMIVSDNAKLMRKGTRRQLGKMGFDLLGQDAHGRDVWRQLF